MFPLEPWSPQASLDPADTMDEPWLISVEMWRRTRRRIDQAIRSVLLPRHNQHVGSHSCVPTIQAPLARVSTRLRPTTIRLFLNFCIKLGIVFAGHEVG